MLGLFFIFKQNNKIEGLNNTILCNDNLCKKKLH